MHSRLYRAIALVGLLGATLVSPASAQTSQTALLTLVDGTACRGPITGDTFTLVDARANYACTDGRWVLGDPFTLPDGRQVVMLGRTILQGQRASDGADPCAQPTCLIDLGMTEVATPATLPLVLSVYSSGVGRNTSSTTCTFQGGTTFYVGGTRANYLCVEHRSRPLKDPPRTDVEEWIIGGPFADSSPTGFPKAYVATIVRTGAPLSDLPNAATCDQAVCLLAASAVDLQPGTYASPA